MATNYSHKKESQGLPETLTLRSSWWTSKNTNFSNLRAMIIIHIICFFLFTHTAPEAVDYTTFSSDSVNYLKVTWSAPASECTPLMYNVTRRLLNRDQCDDSQADVVLWNVTSDTYFEYTDIYPHSTYETTVLSFVDNKEAENAVTSQFESNEDGMYSSEYCLSPNSSIIGIM